MTPDPRLRRERRVEFLGQQDGKVERELKSELQHVLRRYPKVARAYLARVGFAPQVQKSVALCLMPRSAEERTIVDEVGALFSDMFSADTHLDILFLTDEEEVDLRRVCDPFFPPTAKSAEG